MKKIYALLFLSTSLFSSCDDEGCLINNKTYSTLDGKAPLILGHRGACGYRPDHTIASYTLAIEMGADFIEPDLEVTSDGYLVCRHEPMIGGTTNVADKPEFASRKTSKMVDSVLVTNEWFVSDFTLAEIKTLRAKQPLRERSQEFNGMFEIPTFQEVIDLAKEKSKTIGRTIGIYPETKHPTFHEDLGLKITDKLIEALTAAGWNNADAPVYVQSFEVSNLRYIRDSKKSTVKLVQLFDAAGVNKDGTMNMSLPNGKPYDFRKSGDSRTYNDLATDAGMDFIKTYANGIGPWKPYIQPYTFTDANGDGNADDVNNDGLTDSRDYKELPATNFVERAHKKGLVVHPYTFRNEPRRLLSDYVNNPVAEYKKYFDLGIDGVFTDFPNTAVSAK